LLDDADRAAGVGNLIRRQPVECGGQHRDGDRRHARAADQEARGEQHLAGVRSGLGEGEGAESGERHADQHHGASTDAVGEAAGDGPLPDTGELRGDLLALLRRAAGRYREFDPDLLHGLLAELPDVQSEIVETNPDTVMTILRRATDRGETDLAGVTPRIARLPLDLLRHEITATHAVVPDAVLVEIVDDIVLPLLAARSRPPAST
jgi:hypothetical protein